MEEEPIQALVFGGAFNPPTRAHISLAEFAMRATEKEKVIFVPSKSRYIQEEQGKDFAFSEEERLSMLLRIAEDRPWMQVSDYEILAAHQPRTYETLCHLREEGIQGAMLIGSDKLRELAGGWRFIPEISREFGIVCMARGRDDVRREIGADPYLSSLDIIVVDTPRETKEFSSTSVRRLLTEHPRNTEALRKMIPEELWSILAPNEEKKISREENNLAILTELERLYLDAAPALHFENPWQLLVAVILSAQCTDVKVNKVTPALFERWPDAPSLAQASPEEIEPYIASCGLYHTKSKNLAATARAVTERFGGRVPADHDQLESLPGVGRKTANVVMSCAFGADAIAVDTHVFRVSNRLGLADASDVLETEKQLMQTIPKKKWSRAHHWLIYHGRQVCHARKPDCGTCTLRPWCKAQQEHP